MNSEQNVLVARLSEIVQKIENKFKEDDHHLIRQTIENEVVKLEDQQNVRSKIDKLEKMVHEANVAITETDGRISNLKTEMNGELRLVHEILRELTDKIEKIEQNTSKEENTRRTWRIALIAAIPGIVSVVIKVGELIFTRSG